MPVLDLDVWNPVFSPKVRKAFWLFSVVHWVPLLEQRRGQPGEHMSLPAAHRAGLHLKCQQDPGHSTKTDKSLFREITTTLTLKESEAQKVLYQTRIGDCREVGETDTDLIWEVKPFYSWNCSATLAVLTWADCNCQDCFLLSSHFAKKSLPNQYGKSLANPLRIRLLTEFGGLPGHYWNYYISTQKRRKHLKDYSAALGKAPAQRLSAFLCQLQSSQLPNSVLGEFLTCPKLCQSTIPTVTAALLTARFLCQQEELQRWLYTGGEGEHQWATHCVAR